jgi:hypothetical protein
MSRIYAAYSMGALLGPMLGAIGGIHAPFTGCALLLAASVPLVMALPAPTGPTSSAGIAPCCAQPASGWPPPRSCSRS